MESKICARCHRKLSLSNFRKRRTETDGLYYWCKGCLSAVEAEYRRQSPEKFRRKSREYYSRNRETINEKRRDFYINNRETVLARNRAWRAKNHDHHLAAKRRDYAAHRKERAPKRREYYLRNRETIRKKRREYYLNNRKRILAKNREYILRVKGTSQYRRRNNASQKRRNARIRAAFVERISIKEVARRAKWICGVCRRCVRQKDAVTDHVKPLALGGEHSYANVQLAHRRCNAFKGLQEGFTFR